MYNLRLSPRLMPTLIRRYVLLASAFFLLLVAAVAGIFLSDLQRRATMAARQINDLGREVQQIERLVSDAESAQRGYLLTGQAAYLDPYQRARHQWPSVLSSLLSKANDPASERLRSVREQIENKFDELERTIALHQAGRAADALDLVRTGEGQRLMLAVRESLDAVSKELLADLQKRRVYFDRVNAGDRSLFIAALLLLCAVAAFYVWDVRRRAAALNEANLRLTREMASRTSAESQVRQLQKMEAVGQLTGGIAHDFNNMLAVILGSLEIAKGRTPPESDAKLLASIDQAIEGARRAANLTARLLAFSRQQALEPRVTNINRLVADLTEVFRRTLGETINVETVLGGGLWRTLVDPVQLESALLNLALNARDAMPNGGELTIETANTEIDERYAAANVEARAGQYVLISVTDAGSGMPPEVAARAFDPFFSTKAPGRGTGLGLSQVYGFITQSGGHIKIYSELDHGTTIKIYLPRHVGADTDVVAAEVVAPSSTPDRPTILLVEDEESVLEVARDVLQMLGYNVIATLSPTAALGILRAGSDVRLLFTDIVMPEMTGKELADQAVLIKPDLKVLYASGYTRNAVVHNGVVDAGTLLLSKPYTMGQLSAKIQQALASSVEVE